MTIAERITGVYARRHLRVLPILSTLRAGYTSDYLRGDLRAAFNVALLAFPQGMAYAAIAGLPIAYGIYGTVVACLVAPLFSGSRFISAGPTNATSVLIFGALLSLGFLSQAERIAALPLVLLMAGGMLIVGAVLKVAGLVQYVSRSVIAGYITAAAIFIIVNQVKKTLGFEIELPPNSTFLDVILITLVTLPGTHWLTAGLSATAGVYYYITSRKFPSWPNVGITLLLFSLISVAGRELFPAWDWEHVKTLTSISISEWTVRMPPLNSELVRELANVALVIAFVCMLEGCSIGKTVAARSGEKIDLNQEILGLGMANLACAFYQGMPCSGSLTRTQLNANSGARTPWATVMSGLMCLVAVVLLGRFIAYIPVCILGVLVIAIGLSLINRHVIRVVWRSTKSDRTVFATTFLAALLTSLDFAIILGVGVSILLFLRKAAQPELVEYTQDDSGGFKPLAADAKESVPEVSIVHVEGDLFFGAAEIFRDQMRRACAKPNLQVVILKMRNAHHLDATSVLALEDLVRFLKESNRALLISEAREDATKIFRASGLLDIVGEENFFPDEVANPTLATSKAIRRAMKLLDGKDAEVKIFLGSSKKAEDA